MQSKRRMIRQEIVGILSRGIPGLKERIFSARAEPIWEELELPCLCVYSASESPGEDLQREQHSTRDLVISVEAVVSGRMESIHDNLDELSNQIEEVLIAGKIFSRNFESIAFTGTQNLIDASTKKFIGISRLDFLIHYER